MNGKDPLIAHLFKGEPQLDPDIPMVYLKGKGVKEIRAFINALHQRRQNWERRRHGRRR